MTDKRPPRSPREPPALGGGRPRQPSRAGLFSVDGQDHLGDDDGPLPKIARTQRATRTAPTAGSRKRRPAPPRRRSSLLAQIVRYGVVTVALLFALVGVAAATLYMLFPVEMVRDRLIAEVKQRTGRNLTIGGTPAVTFWPVLGVALGEVRLSNPPELGGGDLFTAAEAEAAVRLLPLLSSEVHIEHIHLNRPVIDLLVDKQGRRNWDFARSDALEWPKARFAQAGAQTPLPRELEEFVKGSSKTSAANRPGFSLTKLTIVDGIVRYLDQRQDLAEEVRNVNVTVRSSGPTSPLLATGRLSWRGEPVRIESEFAPTHAFLEGAPAIGKLDLTTPMMAVAGNGTLSTHGGPMFEGPIQVTVKSLSQFSGWTGWQLPVTTPGPLDVSGRLKVAGPTASLSDFTLGLDKLRASGKLAFTGSGVRPRLSGTVRLAELDLNAIMVMTDRSAAPAPAGSSGLPQAETRPASIEDLLKADPMPSPRVRGYTRTRGYSDAPISFDGLNALDGDLVIEFGKLVFKELITGAGKLKSTLEAGAARVEIEHLALYDGIVRGVATLSNQSGSAQLGGNLVAEGVSVLPLMKSAAGFDWIEGRARIALALTGSGRSERQIVSTLNGKAELRMGDGAVVGFNVPRILRGVRQGQFGNFERVATEKTDFSELYASITLSNGIGRSDDLRLNSPLMRATGNGVIDLPGQSIDYTLLPRIVGTLQGQQGAADLRGLEIPIRITGALEKPDVRPDLSNALNNLGGAAGAVGNVLNAPKEQVRELGDAVKGALSGQEGAKERARTLFRQMLR